MMRLARILLLFHLTGTAVASRLLTAFANNGSLSLHQLTRLLAIGDFEEFNQLFKDAKIQLPDADVSRSGLTLRIRNLYCHDVAIGDIQTNFTRSDDDTSVTLGVFVSPFEFVCTADYSYKFLFFRGSGQMVAKSRGNQANTRISFTSPSSFAQDPPATTAISSCSSKINVYDVDFHGGVIARILDLLEEVLEDVISDEVEGGMYIVIVRMTR